MDNKKNFWKGALCGALVTSLVIGLIGSVWFLVSAITKFGNHTIVTDDKLNAMQELIDDVYLYSDEVDEDILKESMLKGYVYGLGDPYSIYYDKEETKELLESTAGEFSGIGVALTQDMKNNLITFVNVYKDSPAEEAGFQNGDILYKVNGVDITAEDLSNVVTEIKGEEGTQVQITVLRGEELEEVTADVTRRKIEVRTVEYEMKENQIGYIAISEFDTVTYVQFKEALTNLQNQKMQGLVVDLRNNPGGNLDTVCNILDLLLPEGTIVYTEDKKGERDTYTSDEEHKLELPMAVLVNENSASASEIFAGAMQDYDAAEIVGMTTYGKGIVQQLFPMTDGTCVKLTISEYFTPNGRNIHGKGIVPDVEIQYEYSEENPNRDNQFDKAIEVVEEKINQ